MSVGAGLEYLPVPLIALRGGYILPIQDSAASSTSGIRGGLGFNFKSFKLDYAIQPDLGLAISHRISLILSI